LFSISECFVSGCRFSVFGFMLSPAKILRHKTYWGRPSLLITTLVKPKDKYASSYLGEFGFDTQLRLLSAVGSASGFYSYTRYRSMHYSVVQKAPLISTGYWTVAITDSKYHGMCVPRLYTMELKCLHVNTSCSITELCFYVLTRRSLFLKNIYNINIFTHKHTITMNKMASQGLWQQLYCSGLNFPALEGGES
jgi:hypothetical protein